MIRLNMMMGLAPYQLTSSSLEKLVKYKNSMQPWRKSLKMLCSACALQCTRYLGIFMRFILYLINAINDMTW